MVEILEDRTCPSGLVVTTSSDAVLHPGVSLRDAIATANADAAAGLSDKITFDQTLNGATVTLSQGQLELTSGSGTTTIDGASQIAISGNNASRVFAVDTGAHVALAGLTIENGNRVNVDDGGGIFSQGTLTASNCTFSGNSANRGGGIWSGGTVTLSYCTLTDNSAPSGYGGGIDNGGTLALSNCTLSHNSADHGNGGGIHSDSGTVTVSNSTLSVNSAGFGGGIDCWAGTVTVSNCNLTGNSAAIGGGIDSFFYATVAVSNSNLTGNSAHADGGGIYSNSSGTLTVVGCILSGNSASDQGGGIDCNLSTLTVSTSTLSGNSALAGGGIYNDYGNTLIVSNSTFAGNMASSAGGGIYNIFGPVTVSSSTLAGNSTAGRGGGIYNYHLGTVVTVSNSTLAGNSAHDFGGGIANEYGGSVLLKNTIVANSTSGGDLYQDTGLGSSYTGSYDLIGDGSHLSSFTHSLQGNPLLAPLANNCGPTQTMALLPGSPAIDAGDPTAAPPWDQRGPGYPRVVNGKIDIGAYEHQAVTPTITCSVALSLLWPLNDKLVNVGLRVDVQPPNATLHVQVYADDNASASDASDLAPGTLQLRASRQGSGQGRVYLIVVTATAGGPTAFDVCTVVVPHDQSAGAIAQVQAAAAAAKAYYRQFQTAPAGYALLGQGPMQADGSSPAVVARIGDGFRPAPVDVANPPAAPSPFPTLTTDPTGNGLAGGTVAPVDVFFALRSDEKGGGEGDSWVSDLWLNAGRLFA